MIFSYSDWITVIGTIVTLISTVITIIMAKNASRASREARDAMSTIQYAAVVERLRLTQEHIRELAPPSIHKRGFKVDGRVNMIRREFDTALSALPELGRGSGARSYLKTAQNNLNAYHTSLATKADEAQWQSLQSSVQDAISALAATLIETGESK